jgi:hypothetical protein
VSVAYAIRILKLRATSLEAQAPDAAATRLYGASKARELTDQAHQTRVAIKVLEAWELSNGSA